eukprot:21741_1
MLNNLMNFAPSQRTSDVPPPPPPPAGISGPARPQVHMGTGYGSRVDTASLSRHSSGTNSPLGSPPLTPLIDQTIAQPNSIRSTPNLISGPGVGITTPMISTGSVSASAGTIMGQSGSQAGIMQLGRAGIADTSILQTSAPPAADMRRLQAAQKFMYTRAPHPVTLGARLTGTTMLTPQQRRAQSVGNSINLSRAVQTRSAAMGGRAPRRSYATAFLDSPNSMSMVSETKDILNRFISPDRKGRGGKRVVTEGAKGVSFPGRGRPAAPRLRMPAERRGRGRGRRSADGISTEVKELLDDESTINPPLTRLRARPSRSYAHMALGEDIPELRDPDEDDLSPMVTPPPDRHRAAPKLAAPDRAAPRLAATSGGRKRKKLSAPAPQGPYDLATLPFDIKDLINEIESLGGWEQMATDSWCRYCGARFASAFSRSPWGPRRLCTPHYVKVFQHKSLILDRFVEEPTTAINPAANTEKGYLERILTKLRAGSKKPKKKVRKSDQQLAPAPAPRTYTRPSISTLRQRQRQQYRPLTQPINNSRTRSFLNHHYAMAPIKLPTNPPTPSASSGPSAAEIDISASFLKSDSPHSSPNEEPTSFQMPAISVSSSSMGVGGVSSPTVNSFPGANNSSTASGFISLNSSPGSGVSAPAPNHLISTGSPAVNGVNSSNSGVSADSIWPSQATSGTSPTPGAANISQTPQGSSSSNLSGDTGGLSTVDPPMTHNDTPSLCTDSKNPETQSVKVHRELVDSAMDVSNSDNSSGTR